MTNALDSMQDSGPGDSRLLARLLEASVIVVDAKGAVRFASPGACDLLGASGEEALREHWRAYRTELGVDDWPVSARDGEPRFGCADLHTGQGLLRVRFEIHRIEDSGEPRAVVLLRDRSRLTRGDRALLLACEALANRHALGGLVHSGKGPLNNFNLTLALLTAAITRGEGVSPDVQARSLRYVDVLRAEAGRLAHYLEEMHGLVMPRDCAPESFDIAAMLRESARTLHHGATLREIELATDVPDAPVLAFGEPEQVRLALLALTLSLIDATPAGGVVTCAIEPEESGDRVARIALSTSREGVPARLAASLFRVACTAGSDQAAAIAGRMIIEAQGGDVAIGRESTGRPAIVLGLPTRGA